MSARQPLPDNSRSRLAVDGGFPGGGGGAAAGLVWGRLFSPLEVPDASFRGTLGTGTSSVSPLWRARRLFLLHSSWQSWWWGRLETRHADMITAKQLKANLELIREEAKSLIVEKKQMKGTGRCLGATDSGGGILLGSMSHRNSLLRACSDVQRRVGSRVSIRSSKSSAAAGKLCRGRRFDQL